MIKNIVLQINKKLYLRKSKYQKYTKILHRFNDIP